MATQHPSAAKVCRICHADCSNKPRTKDRAGNYYCKGCYEQAMRSKESAGARVTESKADTCEHCDEPLPPGAAMCMHCGFNRKTGQCVQGASSPSEKVRGGIAGTLSNEPSIGGAAILDPVRASGVRPYFQDLLVTLMFPRKVGSLISFIVMWGVLVLGSFGGHVPLFGIVIVLMVAGWYAAYRLAILVSAAGGDEEVSMLSLEGGIAEGIVYPLFTWVGTWAVAFLPFIVFAITVGGIQVSAMLSGVSGLLEAGGIVAATVALIALGLFLWPMIVLCVSLGGFSALVRIDLILRSIFKTLLFYLLTVGIVMGTQFIDYAWKQAAHSRVAGVSAADDISMLIRVFGLGLTLYLEIVAMRAIGLYYFHFKRRFAWDWG